MLLNKSHSQETPYSQFPRTKYPHTEHLLPTRGTVHTGPEHRFLAPPTGTYRRACTINFLSFVTQVCGNSEIIALEAHRPCRCTGALHGKEFTAAFCTPPAALRRSAYFPGKCSPKNNLKTSGAFYISLVSLATEYLRPQRVGPS